MSYTENIAHNGEIISAHYPYSFSFVRAGVSRNADVLEVKYRSHAVQFLLSRGYSTDVDVRLLLQRALLDRYALWDRRRDPFELTLPPVVVAPITFTTLKYTDNKRRRTAVIETFTKDVTIADATVYGSMLAYKERMSRKLGKPYFVGYPQLDSYITRREDNGKYIYYGFNVQRTVSSHTEGDSTFYPKEGITREIDECGVFLRWRTSYGSWGYWLFSDDYEEEIKTKSIGSWDYYKDRSITRKHLGFVGDRTWKLMSHVPVLADEIDEVKDLYISNEVYLYQGEKTNRYYEFDERFFGTWERVEVIGGNVKFNNPKETYDVSVTIGFKGDITRRMVN